MNLSQMTPDQFDKANEHVGFILPDMQIWAGDAGDCDPIDIIFELADKGVIKLPDLGPIASECGHPECYLIEHLIEQQGYVGWRKSQGEVVIQRPELDS